MNFSAIRLFTQAPLHEGASITLEGGQAHYVSQVMRRKTGDSLLLFNGQEGEWLAVIAQTAKKSVTLDVKSLSRAQKTGPDIWLAFAPLKHAPMDFLMQKATELGVSALYPVTTRHSVVSRVNAERMLAGAIEAAEQCERLDIPAIQPVRELGALLGSWPQERRLIFGDESGGSVPVAELVAQKPPTACAALVGPEGGFAPAELDVLRRLPYATGVGLGPRVLRAETAAITLLACLQLWAGDWQEKPGFRASS